MNHSRPALRASALIGFIAASTAAAGAQELILATSSPVNPQLLTVDPANGNVLSSVPISGEEALFGGLTRDGADLYSIDGYNDPNSDRAFRIDSATGTGTVVGDTGFNWNFRCVENHPQTDILYASRDNELYTIDETTGDATSIAAITGATLDQFTCFAIDAAGLAYGLDIGGTGLFQLNLATGALTHLGDLNLPNFAQDVAFDGSHQLWAVLSSGSVYTIDVSNATSSFEFNASPWGGLTFVGDSPAGTPICFGDGSATACPCLNDGGTGEGCANGTGSGGELEASGTPSVSADTLTLTADGVINNNGLFFQGNNTIGGGAGTAFGDGIRCCGGSVVRIQVVNPPGTTSPATAQMTETATTNGPNGTIVAGGKKCYQFWYRDPSTSPCGTQFNLTNAVTVTWVP